MLESGTAKDPAAQASEFALSGLVFGIGLLDAVEVLRYMDAVFRQQAVNEGENENEPTG